MENIKLTELLHACLEFKKEPKDEKLEEINKIVDQFQIRTYLPLVRKQLALIVIANSVTDDMDAIEAAINVHSAKTLYGILGYVTNLEIDVEYSSITPGIIDILYEMGIVDKVLEYCEKDYRRLENIYNEVFDFTNVERIAEVPSLLSEEKMDEVIKTLNSLKTELTPEMLEAIKKISTETSPEWQALKETFAEQIHDSIMNKTMSELAPKKEEKPEDLKDSKVDFAEEEGENKE